MYLPATHRAASFCASSTPCQELALKDLSDSLPTSVTSPTLYVFEQLELVPPPEPPLEPHANAAMTTAPRTATRPNNLISVSQLGLRLSRTRARGGWRQSIAKPPG